MQTDILFYITILSQIFFLSYYFPKKMHERMRYVFKTYPPKNYPKLYPRSDYFYNSYHSNFRLVNRVIMLLGFVLIGLGINGSYSPTSGGAEVIVFVYAMVQFTPMIVVEISEFKQFKLMREVNVSTTRKADLQPRRLMDFIPPKLFALAAIIYVVAILFDFAVHDYNFTWGHDSVERAIILTLGNVYFVGMISWQMFTKKRNPHQQHADRMKALKMVTKIATVTSIMLSLFFMSQAAGDVIDMEIYEPIIFSIYFQIIAIFGLGMVLKRGNIDCMNFDVYKADA